MTTKREHRLPRSILFGVFLCLPLYSTAGYSEGKADCAAATAALQKALNALPTDCTNASDCQSIYLLPNSCAPGSTVSRKGLPEALQQLEPLRVTAFQACLTESANRPVCNRPYAAPDCKAKRCVSVVSGHAPSEQMAPE